MNAYRSRFTRIALLFCVGVIYRGGVPQPAGWAQEAGAGEATEQAPEAGDKTVTVTVVDAAGQPVAEASAIVQLAGDHVVRFAKTDETGLASFDVPSDAKIVRAAAWKDHMGLDYRSYELPRGQQADAITEPPAFPDAGETLTLDGAVPLKVEIVDDERRPLSGVRVFPWLLRKESENNALNLSFFHDKVAQETGADGTTTFAWMPAWQESRVTFWPSAPGFVRERGNYDPQSGDGELNIVLPRLVAIRGSVRTPDGQPAAGIQVVAAGAGYSIDDGRESTFTEKDGTYELNVPPDQVYLLLVEDQRWAATPHTGFVVERGRPIEDMDLQLRPATRVHGRLLNEDTREPIPAKSVYVYQYGQDLHSMEGTVLPNPENSRRWVQPMHVFRTNSDEQGNFEFFLGDGNFDIRPPRQEKADKFEIAGETDLALDVTTKVHREVELTGIVRDESGKPVAGARVEGVPRRLTGLDWRATTDREGRFTVKRNEDPTFVYVIGPDKTRAAIVEVEPQQTDVTVSLEPVASATGRLLTHDTKEPWSGQTVRYGVKVPSEDDQTWSYRFGGQSKTGEDGIFRITGLVPGREYSLNLTTDEHGSIPHVTNIKLAAGETADLGDLRAPEPYEPYVPPTLEQRTNDAFDVAGTPLERHERALDLIRLVNQHLLVVFGTPEDPRIKRLMKIRFEDADYRAVGDEFRMMAIPTDESRRAAAVELAALLDESLADERGEFLLVIRNRDGEKVAVADAAELCDEDELSKDRLIEWLGSYQPEPANARELLAAELALAKSEDKRVIVQETATWCGPCHRLSRFLDGNRVWEKDYRWVKIDHRLEGARELMAEIRDGADGGIPWFAILDASGEKLATSNDPESKRNIGFPSSQAGRAHFESMLRTTRRHLSDEEISELVGQLADSNP